MLSIKPYEEPIEVESAFGGLDIYVKNALISAEYKGLSPNGEEFCEHVNLHSTSREQGFRLYIVPSLVNGGLNNHSKNVRLKVRIIRRLRHMMVVCAGFLSIKIPSRKNSEKNV